jgi:ribosomal protein L37AE/L43A
MRRINGTPRPVGLFLIRTVAPAPRVTGPPRACPFCTSDRLLERLSGGWILCNVCAKIYRDPA